MVAFLEEDWTDRMIPLSELHTMQELGIVDRRWVQRSISEDHLYLMILSDPSTWENLLITKTDQGYLVVGGQHRDEAAKLKGMTEIRATCHSFKDEKEMLQACFHDNLHHGLPADEESRSKYAWWLKKTYPKMKQVDIGAEAHIKQPTVSAALQRWAKVEAEEREREAEEKRRLQAEAAAPPEPSKPEGGAEGAEALRPDIELEGLEEEPPATAIIAPVPRPPTEEERMRKELQRTTKHISHEAKQIVDFVRPLDSTERRDLMIEFLAPESIPEREALLAFADLIKQAMRSPKLRLPPK